MRLSRGLLWLDAALFAAYGLAYLVAPDFFSHLLTGAAYPTAAMAIDARAVYGGTPIGFAALLALIAPRGRTFQAVGQLGCTILFACIAAGRLIGMIVTHSPSPLMIVVLSSEIVGSGLSMYAYAQLKKQHEGQAEPRSFPA